MRLPAVSEATLRATLRRYYATFGGWTPMNAGGSLPTTAGIREKHQALEAPQYSHEGLG